MKITVQVDPTKTRKRVPRTGGPMTPKRGKGAYKRKGRDNNKIG